MKHNIYIMAFIFGLVAQGCMKSEFINKEQSVVLPESLSLTRSEVKDMIVGEKRRLLPVFSPAEVTDASVSYFSENESVAKVSTEGILTATGLGETVVSVVSNANPDLKTTCAVSVTRESGIVVTDDVTGEVVEGLSEDLKLQLFEMSVYFDDRLKSRDAQDNRYPNHGLKWTSEEDEQLLTEYQEGKTIKELSAIHRRSNGAIRSRLLNLNVIK